jgi:exosortase
MDHIERRPARSPDPAPRGLAELLYFWNSFPNRAALLILLLGWLGLFHFFGNSTFGYFDTPSLLEWMGTVYSKPESDDAHGLLLPFVVLGILWWKREKLRQIPRDAWWPGLLLFAGAVMLHIFGFVIQQPRVSIVALYFGIYCLTGLAWGSHWLKETAFPFGLFIFAIPFGTLVDGVALPLRLIAAKITVGLAHGPLGVDVIREGTQIMDPKGSFQYDVAVACSGLRSLISLILLSTIYAFMSFTGMASRGLLIAAAIPLAIICNVLRLTTIILAAEIFGQSAGNFVHEKLALLFYIPAIVGLLLLGKLLNRFGRRTDDIDEQK